MSLALFTGGIGPGEIIVVLFLILILFGSKRLPELARSLGRSLSEFKRGKSEGEASLPPAADKGTATGVEKGADAPREIK